MTWTLPKPTPKDVKAAEKRGRDAHAKRDALAVTELDAQNVRNWVIKGHRNYEERK